MKSEDIIRWWESRRLKYNAYAVFSGVLCLVGMKVFNSASVNFFMLPILVLYLLALNVAYTIRYMFIIWNKKSVNEQILFRWMTGGTIALNLLLGLLVVTLVRQRQYLSPEKQLTGGGAYFWDVYDFKKKYITYSYSFSADGSWRHYICKEGKRTRMPKGDMVYPDTWSLEGDSLLIIGGFKHRILKLENDTLVLLSERGIDTTLLIKSSQGESGI